MKQCPICSAWCKDTDFYCLKCNHKLPTTSEKIEPEYSPQKEIKQAPVVSCPYCKSTNTSRITSMEKVVNVALFGLLGNKRKKQWHCNSCKSDF